MPFLLAVVVVVVVAFSPRLTVSVPYRSDFRCFFLAFSVAVFASALGKGSPG